MEKSFKRHEIKYLITINQYINLMDYLSDKVEKDVFYKSTICNIYYDTDNFELIRKSIEKPIYKEKLRIRSYDKTTLDSSVYVELKKKYDHIVYKRREKIAYKYVLNNSFLEGAETQIYKEIKYFNDFYGGLTPKMFLSYERVAYYFKDDKQIRITFDTNIKYRTENVNLLPSISDIKLLPNNLVLMELKVPFSIPYDLAKYLSSEKIFKRPFSKYGTAYKQIHKLS
jgi:hypothetical protein